MPRWMILAFIIATVCEVMNLTRKRSSSDGGDIDVVIALVIMKIVFMIVAAYYILL